MDNDILRLLLAIAGLALAFALVYQLRTIHCQAKDLRRALTRAEKEYARRRQQARGGQGSGV